MTIDSAYRADFRRRLAMIMDRAEAERGETAKAAKAHPDPTAAIREALDEATRHRHPGR